jgi:hypothetical protein
LEDILGRCSHPPRISLEDVDSLKKEENIIITLFLRESTSSKEIRGGCEHLPRMSSNVFQRLPQKRMQKEEFSKEDHGGRMAAAMAAAWRPLGGRHGGRHGGQTNKQASGRANKQTRPMHQGGVGHVHKDTLGRVQRTVRTRSRHKVQTANSGQYLTWDGFAQPFPPYPLNSMLGQ